MTPTVTDPSKPRGCRWRRPTRRRARLRVADGGDHQVVVHERGVEAQDGHIGGAVAADDLDVDGPAVAEDHVHLHRVLDDVVVGEDVAARVEDDAGAA